MKCAVWPITVIISGQVASLFSFGGVFSLIYHAVSFVSLRFRIE